MMKIHLFTVCRLAKLDCPCQQSVNFLRLLEMTSCVTSIIAYTRNVTGTLCSLISLPFPSPELSFRIPYRQLMLVRISKWCNVMNGLGNRSRGGKTMFLLHFSAEVDSLAARRLVFPGILIRLCMISLMNFYFRFPYLDRIKKRVLCNGAWKPI